MIYKYKGAYSYNENIVSNWESSSIGVYYCGYLNNNNNLVPLYIGVGTGKDGIRDRLLDHLREEHWSDVTHFGFCICSTAEEAENYEKDEIHKFNPKYNTLHAT